MKRDIDPETGEMTAHCNKTEDGWVLNVIELLDEASWIERFGPLGAKGKELEEGLREWYIAHKHPPGSETLNTGALCEGRTEPPSDEPFEPPRKAK